MAPIKSLIIGMALGLLFVACGGGDESSDTTLLDSSPTATPAPSADPTSTTEPDQGQAPDLAGSYLVTHFHSSSLNSTTELWPETAITLVLGSDGSIFGNAGCNDYSGTYEVSGPYITEKGFDDDLGQEMTLSDLTWSEKACDDELLMEQEAEFLDALQNVDRWWVGEGFGDDSNALLLLSLDDGLRVQASLDA